MAKTIPFALITPTAIVCDSEAELVIAPGAEGEVGILPQHAPYLTALKPGVLRINLVDGDTQRRLELATSSGFLQALPNRVVVIVDAAFEPNQIDVDSAKADLEAATKRQQAANGDLTLYHREQEKIDFAQAKLTVASHSSMLAN